MAGRKRRRSARKNPVMIKGKWYFDETEIEKYREGMKGLKPKSKSSYSAADAKLLSALGYSTGGKKETELSYSAAKKLIKKLEHDKKLATPAEARKIDATIKKVERSIKGATVEDALKRLSLSQDKSDLAKFSKMLSSRGPSTLSKLLKSGGISYSDVEKEIDVPSVITEDHILGLLDAESKASGKGKAKSKAQELEALIRSMVKSNPSKGGKKMAKAKKKGKKATKRKVKKSGKKTVRKTKGKARKAKGRKSSKRKVKRLALTKAAMKKFLAGESRARSYLKSHKKAKAGPKKAAKVSLKWKRGNPGIKDAAISIGKIALAGAAAGVALQLANKFAKPMLDKIIPSAIADLKVGPAPVGQILLSCLMPGLLAAGLKMVRHPVAQQVSDVIIVTTAANAGQRLVGSFLPGGMAGEEPVLMGVEPQLMGSADFGEADFGEADFGAVEQFSGYGVEPQLMGEADFGAVEQFSGYGAVQQYSGYGEDEDFAGEDEDYAGEDDMDGAHLG